MLKEPIFNFSKKPYTKLTKGNKFLWALALTYLVLSIPMGIYDLVNLTKNLTINTQKNLEYNQQYVSKTLSEFNKVKEKIKEYNEIVIKDKKDESLRKDIIAGYSVLLNDEHYLKFIFANSIINSFPLAENQKNIYEKDRELFNILFNMFKANKPHSDIAKLDTKCIAMTVCLNNTQNYNGKIISDDYILIERKNLVNNTKLYEETVYNLEHLEEYKNWYSNLLKDISNSDKQLELSPGAKYVKQIFKS